MRYTLTQSSKNKKTGPMPVATISKDTCPTSCPLRDGGGCYAEHGPLAIHWRRVTDGSGGMTFDEFTRAVRRLPPGIWRYGQAGDLPGEGDSIDRDQLLQLARANRGRPVIAFSHKPPTEENLMALKDAEDIGFLVNLSANDLHEADRLIDTGRPVVAVVPSEYARRKDESLASYRRRQRQLPQHTPQGRRIAVCPATYADTNCISCGACSQRRSCETVIVFPAHGSKARTIDRTYNNETQHGPNTGNGPINPTSSPRPDRNSREGTRV